MPWPRQEEPRDAIGRAAQLWQRALSSPLHSPFCACLGIAATSLGPLALEEDLLDFLEPRYGAEPSVLALLHARRAAAAEPFALWLRHAAQTLPEAQQERLAADITTVLESIVEASSGSRFSCA